METGSVITNTRTVSTENTVEMLVQEFVSHMEKPAHFLDDTENAPQVVFSVVVNGMRYILLRRADVPAEQSANLSPREREIVRMIIKGLPNKYIAHVLDISPHTVATYMKRIFAKLGVNSRVEIVTKALTSNLW